MNAKILLVEDDESFAQSFKLMLREHPIEVVWAPDAKSGIRSFQAAGANHFATVVIDYVLPDMKGSEVCQHLRRLSADQEFLFTSGHQEPEFLTDILETGSAGFLVKGRGVEEMRERVLRSVDQYQKKSRVVGKDAYSPSQAELELRAAGFIGRSESLYQILKETERYRASPYRTLIVGETGVGKELVARALVPPGRNLVAINCAAFRDKENLLESELFGYVKGAFTGAEKDTVGLVMQAHNNVLFLDELHHLSLSAQAKLYRFLQEMKFRRVGDGSGREISVDFKLIAAVQPDIKERVADGRFTKDLIRRVSELVIQVPPLRERPEDIEPLVRHFQEEYNAGKPQEKRKQFRISTIHEMTKHSWDGNVRTLRGAVRKMLTDCQADIVNPRDFKFYLETDFLGAGNSTQADPASLETEKDELQKRHITDALARSRTRSEAASGLACHFPHSVEKQKNLGSLPSFISKQKENEQYDSSKNTGGPGLPPVPRNSHRSN